VAVLLILAIGFRREVGSDWGNYLYIFNYIKATDLSFALQRTEPAYAVLNWIAAEAGWGIWFPNLVCAAIFTWGLLALCRLQPNPWLALVVALPYFIIGVGMGYTRQSAALGFLMLAIAQLIRGKTPSMLVSLALAPLFHTSAIVALPLIGLALFRRGIGAAAMVAVLGGFLLFAFGGYITGRLEAYTEGEYIGGGAFTAGGAVPRIMMNVLPALIFLSFRNRFTASALEFRLWTNFALAALLTGLLLFLIDASALVDRMGLYLIPLQIFVLSRMPAAFGSGLRQNMLMLSGILAYSLTVQLVWLNLGTWGGKWLPYNNYIWDQGPPDRTPER
jgi:hypothetical protein